jgi:hypothetical protein
MKLEQKNKTPSHTTLDVVVSEKQTSVPSEHSLIVGAVRDLVKQVMQDCLFETYEFGAEQIELALKQEFPDIYFVVAHAPQTESIDVEFTHDGNLYYLAATVETDLTVKVKPSDGTIPEQSAATEKKSGPPLLMSPGITVTVVDESYFIPSSNSTSAIFMPTQEIQYNTRMYSTSFDPVTFHNGDEMTIAHTFSVGTSGDFTHTETNMLFNGRQVPPHRSGGGTTVSGPGPGQYMSSGITLQQSVWGNGGMGTQSTWPYQISGGGQYMSSGITLHGSVAPSVVPPRGLGIDGLSSFAYGGTNGKS